MKKVAIVGGGPSGILCAIIASKKYDVTIFCNQEKLGKKILVTGNGKCNLTNLYNFDKAYNRDISNYLKSFDNIKTIKFFEEIGLLTYADEDGRIYPISNTANSVLDVLINQVCKNNINVMTNQTVLNVLKKNDGFVIQTQLQEYNFDKVVIAVGSQDSLLKQMGISYNSFSPSLVALKTKEDTFSLSGMRLSNVKAILKGEANHEEYGEVLFKENGLSGICIFNLSAYLARQKNYNSIICLDLLPNLSNDKLKEIFIKRLNKNYTNSKEFMQGLFSEKINSYILKNCAIKNNEKITKKDIGKIINTIKNLTFNIVGHYQNNQVNSGGVDLNNLTNTLEYKYVKNLYFIGEVVDVDGICGGYNLQWSWTSAVIAGEAL